MKLETAISETKTSVEETAVEFTYAREELLGKLDMILDEYLDQRKMIDGKLKRTRSDMYIAIAVFLLLVLVDTYFSVLLRLPGGFVMAFTWEMWAVSIFLTIALIKGFMNLITKIAECCIQNEWKLFEGYRIKRGIVTFKDEERYCSWRINETRSMQRQLRELGPEDSLAPFYDFQYIEKRADEHSFDLMERNAILCYGIGFLLYFLCSWI